MYLPNSLFFDSDYVIEPDDDRLLILYLTIAIFIYVRNLNKRITYKKRKRTTPHLSMIHSILFSSLFKRETNE